MGWKFLRVTMTRVSHKLRFMIELKNSESWKYNQWHTKVFLVDVLMFSLKMIFKFGIEMLERVTIFKWYVSPVKSLTLLYFGNLKIGFKSWALKYYTIIHIPEVSYIFRPHTLHTKLDIKSFSSIIQPT